MNALFLGYGRMGSALGEAWLQAGLVDRISAVDPHAQAGGRALHYPDQAAVPAQAFDLILVATKPGHACTVLATLPDALCQGAVVISVAAGISCASLAEALRQRCPVVRAMPNTPVLVGAGCTGLYADAGLDEARRQRIGRLFDTVGNAHWVAQEGQLDAVTALSGSGPAYYHLFSEALADAGVVLGLPAQLARDLAAQTALGAALLQTQEGVDFVDLRNAVTSPNGTTAAAIARFEQDQALRRLVEAAARAAFVRSQELSQGA